MHTHVRLSRTLPRARQHPVGRARLYRDEPGVTRSDRQREKGSLGPPRRGTYGLVHVYPSRPPAASQGRLRGSRLPVSPRRQTHHSFYGPSGAEQSQDPNIAVGRARTAVRARRTDTVAGNTNPRHGPHRLAQRAALAKHQKNALPTYERPQACIGPLTPNGHKIASVRDKSWGKEAHKGRPDQKNSRTEPSHQLKFWPILPYKLPPHTLSTRRPAQDPPLKNGQF